MSAGSPRTAPVTVTSLAAFEKAIGAGAVTIESFAENVAGEVKITFECGVVSELAEGDLSLASSHNHTANHVFEGFVDGSGTLGALTLTWSFPVPVVGFVADFSNIGFLDVTIPGSGHFFDVRQAMGDDPGQFGLVDSTTAFTQIQFSAQHGLNSGRFRIANLRFAKASSHAAVPGVKSFWTEAVKNVNRPLTLWKRG